MKYLIYLFQILVLGYISEINTSDGSDNHTWKCASEGCDDPIAEVQTVANRKLVSQNGDLAFQIGEQGKCYKMSTGDNAQWLVEINGKRGLIPETNLRVVKWIKPVEMLVPEVVKPEATSASERKLEILGTQINVGDLEGDPGGYMAETFESGTSPLDQARYPGPPELTKSGLNLTPDQTARTDQTNTTESDDSLPAHPADPDGSQQGLGLMESQQASSSGPHDSKINSSSISTTADANPDLIPVQTDIKKQETVGFQSEMESSSSKSADSTADVAGIQIPPQVGAEQVVGHSSSLQTEQFNGENVKSSHSPVDTKANSKNPPEEPDKVKLETNQESSSPNPLEVTTKFGKTAQEDTNDEGMVETEDDLGETVSEESDKEPSPVNPNQVKEAQSTNMSSESTSASDSVPSSNQPTTDGNLKTDSSLENTKQFDKVPASEPAYPQVAGYKNYPSSDPMPSSVPQTEYAHHHEPQRGPIHRYPNHGYYHGSLHAGDSFDSSTKLKNGAADDSSASSTNPSEVSSPAVEPPGTSSSPVLDADPSIIVEPTSTPTSPDSPSDKVVTSPNGMAQGPALADSGSPSFKPEDKAGSTPIKTAPQADSTVSAGSPDVKKSSAYHPQPNIPDGAGSTSDANDQETPPAVPETSELPAEPDSTESATASDNASESSAYHPQPNIPDVAGSTSDANDQETPLAVPETSELSAEPDSTESTTASDNASESSAYHPQPNIPDGAGSTSDANDQETPPAVPEPSELPADVNTKPESSDNGEPTSWYAPIGTGLSYFSELFTKSELPTPESSDNLSESDYCHKDGECPTEPQDSTSSGDSSSASNPMEETKGGGSLPSSEGSPYTHETPPEEDKPLPSAQQEETVYTTALVTSPTMSLNSLLYIVITSVVILIFSLGYYYIEKNSRLSDLIGQMNTLSQELFITKKERDTLEEQLMKVEENYTMMDTSKMRQDSEVILLQKALEESQSARVVLEESVARLEKEVETLMENGMEMHNLLSETITEEERSQLLLANIEELKGSLDARLEEIVALTDQLNKRNEEIQLLQLDVRNGNDKQRELERKLEGCKAEVEQESTVVIHQLQKKIIELQQLVEEKSVEGARLEGELVRVRTEAAGEGARAIAAEAALQEAHAVGAGKARTQWLDATQARAELARAEQRAKDLATELASAHTNSQHLQEKINSLHKEISLVNSKYENVEKDKVNALTKLQVLSDYFKEKESKLQEELGMKESLWLQKESEDHTIYEQMKSLREEISSYKAQNETLKAEIIEQESSYKVQIANEEQKSYDNWVALRQAERKIKELQNEASHFRNMITQMESAANHSGPINPNGVDLGKGFMGVSAPSPPFMVGGPPPPPLDLFMPPPPAARPPPLGRISSPPLPADLLPPPPLIPFDFLPHPPSSSTPPPPPIFKPQPRDRPPKDSPPSNYSPESPNEKPIRRRRR